MSDVLLNIAEGSIDEHHIIRINGELANYKGGKTVVQPFEGEPLDPPAPVYIAVVSDDATDTGVDVVIEFIDETWTRRYVLVTTDGSDGTTPVTVPTWATDGNPSDTSSPKVLRVTHAYIGGNVQPAGSIYIYEDGTEPSGGGLPDAADTFAIIKPDSNEMRAAHWSVPTGHLFIVNYGYVSMAPDAQYDDDPSVADPSAAQLLTQESVQMALEFRMYNGLWRRGPLISLNSLGSSYAELTKDAAPAVLPACSDLRIVAIDSVFKGPVRLSAGFAGVLVDVGKTAFREEVDLLDPSEDPQRIADFLSGSRPALPLGDPIYVKLKLLGF